MGNNNSQQIDPQFHQQVNQLSEQARIQQKNRLDMQMLQKQILENQLKIQKMKMQEMAQLQTSSSLLMMLSNSPDKLNQILAQPKMQHEMRNNPQFGLQVIEIILSHHGDSLSDAQYHKIQSYLDSFNQPLQNTRAQHSVPQQQLTPYHLQPDNPESNYFISNQGTRSYDPNQRSIVQQEVIQDTNSLTRHYQTSHEDSRHRYEQEEKRRRQIFDSQQRQRKREFEAKLKEFEREPINAMSLFGLTQNYTLDELKNAYRKLAIRTHPDKGGNPKDFERVTKSYFLLVERYKNHQADKTFNQLREGSRQYVETQNQNPKQSTHFDKDRFSLKLFNQIYDENRIADPDDKGYERWLRDQDDGYSQPQLFSDKFNIDVFNSTFDRHKHQVRRKMGLDIIESKSGPNALSAQGRTGYSTIDRVETDNFGKLDPNRSGLVYSDLKQAYTESHLIDPRQVDYKSYRNVDELERDRSQVSFQMTPEELQRQEYKRREEERQEEERLRRVQGRDNYLEKNYNRIHQMMLTQLNK